MSDVSIVTRTRARVEVETLAGDSVSLIHEREKALYERARDKYLSEFSFSEANDLRGLDRLLLLEVQNFRWQWYQAAGQDYWGVDLAASEEATIHRAIKDIQTQISVIQNDLSLTKGQREKQSEDSVGGYLTLLRRAAKEHGIRREKQVGKAIELINELFAVTGAYKRGNATERRKLGFDSADDILAWIDGYLQPEFNSVDAYFREHQQRFWVREM